MRPTRLIVLLALFPCVASAQPPAGPYGGVSSSDVVGFNASATTAAQAGITSFSSPNLQMPNGGYLSHTIFSATATQTINTASETSCFSATGVGSQSVPLAAFKIGSKFHIQCGGAYTTGVASVATVLMKVKFGSTVIASFTTPALPTSASALGFKLDETCTVRTTGASGTVVCTGALTYASAAIGGAPVWNPIVSAGAVTVDLSGTTTLMDATNTLSSIVSSPSASVYEASIVQEN